MSKTGFILAAALVALGGSAGAAAPAASAPNAAVNLDGSVSGGQSKPSLAKTANRQLRGSNVPSAAASGAGVKAQADADMASRDARAKEPRLHVEHQNLKEDDAARALARQATPNSMDREIAYGNKDHTEQVSNLKVTIKKK